MGPRLFTILAVTFISCIVVLLPDFTSTSELDENFIRKSNNFISCPKNSVILTNESTRMSLCNDKNCCEVGNDKIVYVCLKEQYSISKCTNLKHDWKISENGCYTYQGEYEKIEISIKTSLRYLHIFVLGMSVKFYNKGNQEITTFRKFSHEIDKYRIQLENNTRFLLKVSNSTEEDFSDFFINSEDFINGSISNPPKTSPVAFKVFIILGAIVIILLTLFLLITCFFYRKKRHQQSQKLNVMESIEQDNQDVLAEASFYENTSTQQMHQSLSKVNSSNIAMQDVYAVVDKKKKIPPDDAHGFAPPGCPSDQAANSAIYANVTKGTPQVRNGQQSDGLVREEVNGDIYTLIVKEASI